MISSKWNLRQCGILQLHKLRVTTTHFGFTTAHFGTATRLAEQAENEIKIRCAGLTERVSDNPSEISDSKLLGVEKSLQTLDLEANKILEKVTYYTECVTDLDGCDCVSDMNKLLASTLDNKENFIKTVRQEISDRDLPEEEIKNALGLKIELQKFRGYEFNMDIYTFKIKFEKFVMPYVQKPLLSDTLKLNYLANPRFNFGERAHIHR